MHGIEWEVVDNFAYDFIKEFSIKQQEFFEFFSKWWMFEKALNNSFADVKAKDLAYWVFMQSFAKNRVDQFAETLPKESKEYIDALQEKAEKFERPQ